MGTKHLKNDMHAAGYGQAPEAHQPEDLFKLKTANEWIMEAKNKPIPKRLFGEFWFAGEVCILFADTNVGKSILAVQIANQISQGISVDPFHVEAGRNAVLYFDFELTDKQFEGRYSNNYKDHYSFDDLFIRVEIDPEAGIPEDTKFEDHLMKQIEKLIEMTGAKVLIIDNLTWLKNELEKTTAAAGLMKHLQALKRKHELSILVLAHTPKRDSTRPIDMNDLQGSRILLGFADSCFAIGQSNQEAGIRYLKQIKVRAVEKRFDHQAVVVCELAKSNGNFLEFRYLTTEREWNHLKQPEQAKLDQETAKIQELRNAGKSFRQIAEDLGISHMKVKRVLDRIDQEAGDRVGEEPPF
jgi:archaellum biogenesis ATPase FlaH